MGKGFLAICALLPSAVSGAWASQPEFVPNEVIVKLKATKAIAAYSVRARGLVGALPRRYSVSAHPFVTDPSLYTLKAREHVDMTRFLEEIKANPSVQYAELNYIYHTMAVRSDPPQPIVPNDPEFNLNWGLLNIGQKDSKGQEGTAGIDVAATKAWAFGTGSRDMLVAVIDTGVDYNHPDLKANIHANAGEIPGNGKDDDGNGFIDDVNGWNFEGQNNDPMDDNKHGTHCSGTIGADGNNGTGTAGVNWKVSILPLKFLSASGSGSLNNAVEAINYATKLGVKIMSNSWGGGGFSQTMFDAIKAARDKGILFVAAAGNEGNNNDARASYPASYDLENVISVAATDNRDQKSSWSNYGVRKVHLAAPGVNIYSTVPVAKGSYDTFSGTSMACPHVAGAAALLWSLNGSMTYADVKTRLIATVDPVRTLKRKTLSGGRLNLYNAIAGYVPARTEPPETAWKAVAKAVESVHPYAMNSNEAIEVSHPGAKFIRVHFAKIETEAEYDVIKVKDGKGQAIEELSGELSNYMTDYIEGDKVVISLTSDDSVNAWGFSVDSYEFIE